MLGKQGWQLFTNNTLLVSRILKAKYYPYGDFVSAKLGSNPSLTWRSVVEARLAMLHGYRWKVGDGRNIRVWEDPWIRRDGNMYAESASPIPNWDLRVCALLQQNGEEWDEVRVRSLFHQREAEEVLAMPIVGGEEDSVVWQYSKNGTYSVRSAYRLLLDTCVSMDGLRVEGDWTTLWSLPMQPKIKHFIWRASREVLATRGNLQHRHINVPWQCGLCSLGMETTWHLFMECSYAWECWNVAGIGSLVEQMRNRCESFQEWIMLVLKELNDPQRRQLFAVMWSIWKERNERVWKSSSRTAHLVVRAANEEVANWVAAQARRTNAPTMENGGRCYKWHPPKAQFLKCNVDAAIFADRGEMGLVMCLRNELGDLVQFKTLRKRGDRMVKESEAMALWEGLKWCVERGIERVELEMDAQVVVRAVNDNEVDDRLEFGTIIRRCRDILVTKPFYSVCFVRRECNEIAHVLAKQSKFLDSPTVGELPPVFMVHCMNNICFMRHD
ncbi:Putative ribonuclease H protein At1g65750 [Linum grandiflorum]